MSTDREVYSEGQPLLVYGTGLPSEPLIIRLFAPDGTISQFNQITADDTGAFNHILIRWPNATTPIHMERILLKQLPQKSKAYHKQLM